ncbi:Uncharacterised protein [Chlamydia trachomatis]|nr:Uncharacterised protein [Chlamydia trachomatis]
MTVHTLGAVGILCRGRHCGLLRRRVGVGRGKGHSYFGELFLRHLEGGRVIRANQTNLVGVGAELYLRGGNPRYLGGCAILGQGAVSALDIGQVKRRPGSYLVGLFLRLAINRAGALQGEGKLLGGGNL